MSELWYWRTNGRIRGPLVTEELEAIVLQNRLAAGDAVRLENSDDWIPAADIRQLFSSTTPADSPATFADRLLKSAAARRVNADAGVSRSKPGFLAALLQWPGEVMSHAARLFMDGSSAAWRWLGRTGRTLLTLAAAVGVVFFLVARFDVWRTSDTMRQQQIKAVWRQIQSDETRPQPIPVDSLAERDAWLEKTQSDLEHDLHEQPISGNGSAARKQALGRRQLLYAVRGIRGYVAAPSKEEVARIDQALESAMDYLTGATPVQPAPVAAVPGQSSGGSSNAIAAIVAFDVILIGLGAVWWFRRRRRKKRR